MFKKEPSEEEVAKCDECKTDEFIKMGYLLHRKECKYNLCKKCNLEKNRKEFKVVVMYLLEYLSHNIIKTTFSRERDKKSYKNKKLWNKRECSLILCFSAKEENF